MNQDVTHIDGLGVEGLVPCWVQVSNTGRDIGPASVTRANIGGVLRDSIVVAIDGFDEFLVRLSGCTSHVLRCILTLYILSHKVSTLGSSVGTFSLFATIS